jgi:hypothetical protein
MSDNFSPPPYLPSPARQQFWERKYELATEMSVGHDFRHALLFGQNKLTPPSRNTQVTALVIGAIYSLFSKTISFSATVRPYRYRSQRKLSESKVAVCFLGVM